MKGITFLTEFPFNLILTLEMDTDCPVKFCTFYVVENIREFLESVWRHQVGQRRENVKDKVLKIGLL